MKFRIIFSILLISIGLNFNGQEGTKALAEATTVRIAADAWYPFNGDPNSDHQGYMVDVAKRVLEAKGFKIEYRIMPWARAIAEMKAGRINGVIGATKDEVEGAVFPEESLGMSANVFFVTAESNWEFKDQTSLSRITLGGITDYSYGSVIQDYIRKNQNNLKLIQLTNGDSALEQNIRKLAAKRIEVLVESPEVFWNKLKELGLPNKNFKQAGIAGEKDPIYIAFSPKKENSKVIAETLSNGTAEFRNNGELKEILARYGIEDWK